MDARSRDLPPPQTLGQLSQNGRAGRAGIPTSGGRAFPHGRRTPIDPRRSGSYTPRGCKKDVAITLNVMPRDWGRQIGEGSHGAASRFVIISGYHDYRSKRKANLHFIADELAKRGSTFFSRFDSAF